MHSNGTGRAGLREATASLHDRIDGLYSGFDLTRPESYGRFLTAQAAAHVAAERALTAAGAGEVLADWPRRLRAHLVLADLAALNLPRPADEPLAAFEGPHAVLGGVYVLEGSRLGGRVLARGVPPGLPRAFLDASDPPAWRRLLAVLNDNLQNDTAVAAAIEAAGRVFDLFDRTGRRHLDRKRS